MLLISTETVSDRNKKTEKVCCSSKEWFICINICNLFNYSVIHLSKLILKKAILPTILKDCYPIKIQPVSDEYKTYFD